MEIIQRFGSEAVIFDLDGTILDNNSYHLKAWKQYLLKIGRGMTDEEFNEHLNGRTNKDVVRYLYGQDISEETIWQHTMDKEALYRELYRKDIKPVPGILDVFETLYQHQVPMAIATSGVQVNIDFMFEHVPIRKYFQAVVNSSHISKGKPDPEIFLKTASMLGVAPERCLVFEDAVVGVQAAKSAGMHVIAVTTTEPAAHLGAADLIIKDYTALR